MKKVLLLIAGSLGMFCVISSGELKVSEKPNVPYALKLDQEVNVTDNRGVLIPAAILGLNPSETVKITLTDGTVILGVVKTTEVINKKIYKVFGDVINGDNAGFGFGMAEDGTFGGAVVYRNSEVVYKIQYSDSLKGYIFVRNKLEPKLG
jgi:hypothetical protein